MSKIIQLTAENVKRLRAVTIAPDSSLVVVGGRNAQGKSSVLDAIAMALGGKDEVPSRPVREGADRARIVVETEDLTITRTFAASGGTSLKVESKADLGGKQPSPQAILDKLTGKLTFDPLAFTRLDPRKQADALRRLVGLDFAAHDAERARVAAMPLHGDDVPDVELSAAALSAQLQSAVAQNAAAARRETLTAQAVDLIEQAARLRKQAEELERRAGELRTQAQECPQPVDVSALAAQMSQIDQTNAKVRAKVERAKIVTQGRALVARADELTRKLEELDQRKRAALEAAPFPVPGLGFTDDGVTFRGVPFEQASAAEQMRVSVAIGAALNPKLRVMLVRDGSLLDSDSMAELAKLAQQHDLQVWLERVGAGAETSVVIEDGEVVGAAPATPAAPAPAGPSDAAAAF